MITTSEEQLNENPSANNLHGQMILHYEIFEELGAGGMGRVYRAHDTRLDRDVALKFLQADTSQNKEAYERLLAEARAVAKLDHPNLATIFAVEETKDAQAFIVMALYKGVTLDTYVQEQGHLPWVKALRLALQIAEGLKHAHAQNVIHSDIKPSNIMLIESETIKILDFGLAQTQTPTGFAAMNLGGTLEFMSPEQLRGQAANGQSDIWSLGIMLYKMISGHNPFSEEKEIAASILAVLTRDLPPLADYGLEVPKELESLLITMLAKDLDLRYQTVEEFIGDATTLLATSDGVASGFIAKQVRVRKTQEPKPKLPIPQDTLVGRKDELSLISLYIKDPKSRLVTLLGIGGIGKTRLSLAAADALSEDFADGVYFVSLDALETSRAIPLQIASALAITLKPNVDPLEELIGFLEDTEALIVLDNFEHLMDGVPIVVTLLEACRKLKIIVTSRERLNVQEEWILPLNGLSYPDDDALAVEALKHYASIELFVERAQKVQPDFVLNEDRAAGVRAICRLLRGLPFAIELAAAWSNMLAPEDILEAIRENIDFLESRSRNREDRHRSIRAVFDYSWKLLNAQEKSSLMRLAVFRGLISLDAFKKVIGPQFMILANLVDKSLLQFNDEKNYQIHPVLLPFIEEKLRSDQKIATETREKHADYFLDFLIDEGAKLRGKEQKTALSALAMSKENIRAAWRWAVDNEKLEPLEEASEALRYFYSQKGFLQEGIELFDLVINRFSDRDKLQACLVGTAMIKEAYFYSAKGAYEEAKSLVQKGFKLIDQNRKPDTVLSGLNFLAQTLMHQGEHSKAKDVLQRAYKFAQKHRVREMSEIILTNLGTIELLFGDKDRARMYHEKSLNLSRASGNKSQIANTTNNLAHLFLKTDQPEKAIPLLEESLSVARDMGSSRLIPYLLGNFATAFHDLGAYEKAQGFAEEALEEVRKQGDRSLEINLLIQKGVNQTSKGDFEQAENAFLEALGTANKIKDLPSLLHCIVQLSALKVHSNNAEGVFGILSLVMDHPALKEEDKLQAEQLLSSIPDEPSETNGESVETLATIINRFLKRK